MAEYAYPSEDKKSLLVFNIKGNKVDEIKVKMENLMLAKLI